MCQIQILAEIFTCMSILTKCNEWMSTTVRKSKCDILVGRSSLILIISLRLNEMLHIFYSFHYLSYTNAGTS